MSEEHRPVLAVSVETAEAYFGNRLYADAWNNASATDKAKALVWADTIIENSFDWNDTAYSATEWAMSVQYAVCEQALWLLKVDPSDYPAVLTKGLSSGTAGSVSGTFSKEMVAPLVCRAAVALVGELGTLSTENLGSVKSTMLEA